MAIKPLSDRVLVDRIEDDVQKSPGGIIIPDTAKERPQCGKVIAVGDGRKDNSGKRIAMDVSIGDTVIFGKYAGVEVKDNGKEYLVMNESDIISMIGERFD
jgi:chaperonin GroES